MSGTSREFRAPWSSALWTISLIASLLLIFIVLLGIFLHKPGDGLVYPLFMVVLPMAILVISYFFMVRGYHLQEDTLGVHRLIWVTRIPLNELQSVRVDPLATARSWKVFGNGGLFSFSGYFRNAKLGTYRAWATDPARTVILEYPDRRVVISPDNPEAFADAVRELKGWPEEQA